MSEENSSISRITLLNIVLNIVLQIVVLLTGFVTSKVILNYFGSEVNGLVSSLTQFLNFIVLFEGGITGVISAQLYKPVIEHNVKKISSIIVTSQRFYRKVGVIYIIYTLLLAVIYPLVVKSSFSFGTIFGLTLILSINLIVQYMFSASLRILLTVDKKIYVIASTQIAMYILGLFFGVLSVYIFPNVLVFKFITSIFFFLQPIMFTRYVNKHYKLKKRARPDNNLISKRWDGFAVNLAAFIHFCTDVAVLTLFTDLVTVSIYSVYALVLQGIRHIINAISSAISPNVGRAYAEGNNEKINFTMDINEYIVSFLCFFFFTIAGLLITPFVMIYTRSINDANYYQPLFGVLLVISEFFYVIKAPHLGLAYDADKFKELKLPSYIETIINITLSIIFVQFLGLIGVAIGTICAMAFRLVFHVFFTKKLIPNRSPIIFFKKFFFFSIFTAIGIAICVFLVPQNIKNILGWISHGLIYSFIFGGLYLILSLIFFRKELTFFKDYILGKGKDNILEEDQIIDESKYRQLDKEECNKILIEIFAYFDKFCRDNNINYSLIGGSLIGAIRHKGMIPWDDDIDVALDINNYRKLLNAIKSNTINSKFEFCIPGEREGYPFSFMKLINTETICIEPNKVDEIENYGLYLDIFCFNYMPKKEKDMRKFYNRILFYNNCLNRIKLNYKNPSILKKIKRLVKNTYVSTFGYERMLQRLLKLFNKYSDEPSEYLTTSNPVYGYEKEIYKASYFKKYTNVTFEGIQAMSVKDYDGFLRNTFGDYMLLPPEEERVSHNLKSWIKRQ